MEKSSYTLIDNRIFDDNALSHSEFRVLSYLISKYNVNYGYCLLYTSYFITYLLYNESKTVSQISKIRNIPIADVNDHLIKAKLEIKSANKQKVESSKDILDKFLELGKDLSLIHI